MESIESQMTTPVISIYSEATAQEADQLMIFNKISPFGLVLIKIPIKNNVKPTGVSIKPDSQKKKKPYKIRNLERLVGKSSLKNQNFLHKNYLEIVSLLLANEKTTLLTV
jgi:hypothetical protein